MTRYVARDPIKARTREAGFTLIELLAVVTLMGILLALGAMSLRHFWLVQALETSKDEVVTQLRRQQQRVVAETHPLVYGARFPKGGPPSERRQWGLIRYNADSNGDGNLNDPSCVEYQSIVLGDGVTVVPASSGTAFTDTSGLSTYCDSNLRRGGAPYRQANNDDFAFFFARGNATGGQVTIIQTLLGNRAKTVCVTGLTGRVHATETGSCT